MAEGVKQKMSSRIKWPFVAMLITFVAFIASCSSCVPKQDNAMAADNPGDEKKNEFVNEYFPQDPSKRIYCPCTGVVLDAATKKPIAGAQVMAHVHYSIGGIRIERGSKNKYEFTQTDKDGRYRVPTIFYPRLLISSSFKLIIYKAGYVAYSSSYVFGHRSKKSYFKYKNNTVLLEKWDDKKFTKKDHIKHIDFIRCYSGLLNASKKKKAFCREAREEMILACMAHDRDRGRDLCIEIVDDKLGLSKRREEER